MSPCFPVALATLGRHLPAFQHGKGVELGGTNPHMWIPAPALQVSTWLHLVTCPAPSKPFSLKSKSVLFFSTFLASLHQDRGRETSQGSITDINDIEGNDANCVKGFYFTHSFMRIP